MSFARQSGRLLSVCSRSATPLPLCNARRILQRPLSSSKLVRASGQSDSALVAKLKAELSFETENESSTKEPEWITTFKEEGVWKIEDNDGFDEVALTRSFGNEDIRILFSIADLDSSAEEAESEAEEGEETPTKNEDEQTTSEESFPVRTAITISKSGKGALTVDAVAQDGLFVVDSVAFYKDDKMATDMSAGGDWRRRALYMGPEFDALDESLQQEFEAYLEERGINSNLALFIPDLAEWKEQREYVKWLEGVQKFVEA